MTEHPNHSFRADRRSGKDRRGHNVPEIKSLFIYRRRKKIRREDDKDKILFFDQYGSGIFAVIVFILLLSIIDALLTLFLIDCGASEINPIMAYFLNFGPFTFMSVKYFLTCYSLVVLLIFSNVFLVRFKMYARSLFSFVIGLFLIVIGWELFLTYSILFRM
jgi:hypothetical protein